MTKIKDAFVAAYKDAKAFAVAHPISAVVIAGTLVIAGHVI